MDDPFSVSVQKWIKRAKVDSDLAIQAIAQAALAHVRELTPVRTGYLRAGWTIVRVGDDPGIEGRGDGLSAVLKMKAGGNYLITNPVVYARRIEFGFVGNDSAGRSFHQDGRGMLQQTLAHMPTIAKVALAGLKREAS